MKRQIQKTTPFLYIRTRPEKEENRRLPAGLVSLGLRLGKLYPHVKKEMLFNRISDFTPEEGCQLTLPFTAGELEQLPVWKIREYMDSIIAAQSTENILMERAIMRYAGTRELVDGSMPIYLWLPELLALMKQNHHINGRRLRIIVVDTQQEDMYHIIRQLCRGVNYFTVMTNRPEAFFELAEEIWIDQGLVVDFRKKESGRRMKILPEMIVFCMEELKRPGVIRYVDVQQKAPVDGALLQQALFGASTEAVMRRFETYFEEMRIVEMRKKMEGKIRIHLDTLCWFKL